LFPVLGFTVQYSHRTWRFRIEHIARSNLFAALSVPHAELPHALKDA